MLVLTRKKGERVVIGDDIVVTIIDVKGDSVRIGFDAPRGLPVQRAEIIDAVKAANVEAASASSTAGDQLRDLFGAAPAQKAGAEGSATASATPAVAADATASAAESSPASPGSESPAARRPVGRPAPAPRAPAVRPGTDGA